MKFLNNAIFNGTITANSVADAGTNTDKFLVLNSSGVVTYRTAAELYGDLNIANLPAGSTSTVKHLVKAGVAVTKGQAVYVTSADGTNMIVGKASNASEATSSKTMGLIESTLAINGQGNVITEGLLAGLDTTGATNPGDPVWLGVDGNLIYGLANKPYAPAHLVFIGIVTRINANNGEIFVKVQNGFELKEIHDVDLITTTPVNGHILGYDGTLWVNKTIAGWLGFTPANDSNVVHKSGAETITGIKTFTNEQLFGNGVTLTGGYITYEDSGYNLTLNTNILTANRNVFLQDKAGTIALLSDIPTVAGNYVPTTRNLTINGTTYDLSADRTWTINVPTRSETVFTATANQTTFSVNYTVGAVEVFYNGSKMAPSEFTATNGTSIVLGSGIPEGTILTVVANGTGGGITKAALSATAPLAYDSNTGAFSIQAATGSQNGYLSSGDWTAFNNKVSSQWVTSGSDIYYSTGKVSVGTSTLGRKLSVYSTGGDDHLLIAGVAPSVALTDNMGVATYQAKFGLATSNGQFATGATAGDFVISCQAGSTIWAYNSVEKMRLNTAGKLLIGTTTTASSSLLVVNGGLTATTLVKSGGTSSQFLKADGSVDSNTYLTGITSGQVTGALGYTPYNSTNPNGYITGSTTGNFTINNTSPTIFLQDTDHRSSMIHCNSNIFYILRGSGTNTTSWSTYNGYWPLEINLENNNATFGGNITAVYDVTAYSDARVKTGVTTIENALDKVMNLRGVRYQRTDMEDKKFHIGVIAQETQVVVPEVVTENDKGHLNVAYGNMGGLFIEAIKELKKENNELRDILKRNNLI